jgi:deazaflavin-dependent oxidoreductase (nitroreductase family)
MTFRSPRPSGLLKLGFAIPVWLYRAHLGFLFMGRVVTIVHHGRRSGKRYLTGLEVLVRRGPESYVYSAWGRHADWFRNIEAGGVDELWDGRRRAKSVSHRVLDADQAFEVLELYEQQHARTARQTLPRMAPGYDFSDEARRRLAAVATMVGLTPG